VQILNSLRDLPHDFGSLLLSKFAFFKLLEERTSIHILQHDVEVSLIVIEAIHAKNIFMA
jgi:hypothetical protein